MNKEAKEKVKSILRARYGDNWIHGKVALQILYELGYRNPLERVELEERITGILREVYWEEFDYSQPEWKEEGKKWFGEKAKELIRELSYCKPSPELSDDEIAHILETQESLCGLGKSDKDDGSCSICRSIKIKLTPVEEI